MVTFQDGGRSIMGPIGICAGTDFAFINEPEKGYLQVCKLY